MYSKLEKNKINKISIALFKSFPNKEQEQEQEQSSSPPLARPVPPLPGHHRRTRHPQRRPRGGSLVSACCQTPALQTLL